MLLSQCSVKNNFAWFCFFSFSNLEFYKTPEVKLTEKWENLDLRKTYPKNAV